MTMTYRQGAIGALMDEYERAAADIIRVVEPLDDASFVAVRDSVTEDEDCRSIQTIMQHVARAGFGYANCIRTAFGIPAEGSASEVRVAQDAIGQVRAMLEYMAATLEGRWLMSYDEMTAVSMTVRWGPTYDLEQLFEHAIVHVLRHRRQIERFLTEPQFASAVS